MFATYCLTVSIFAKNFSSIIRDFDGSFVGSFVKYLISIHCFLPLGEKLKKNGNTDLILSFSVTSFVIGMSIIVAKWITKGKSLGSGNDTQEKDLNHIKNRLLNKHNNPLTGRNVKHLTGNRDFLEKLANVEQNEFHKSRITIIDTAVKIYECPFPKNNKSEKKKLANEESELKKRLEKLKQQKRFIEMEIIKQLVPQDAIWYYTLKECECATVEGVEWCTGFLYKCQEELLKKIERKLEEEDLDKDFKIIFENMLKLQLLINEQLGLIVSNLSKKEDKILSDYPDLIKKCKELIKMIEDGNASIKDVKTIIDIKIDVLKAELYKELD